MEIVTNINEAMNFFLSNSSDSVICKNEQTGETKECICYPEAEDFFNQQS